MRFRHLSVGRIAVVASVVDDGGRNGADGSSALQVLGIFCNCGKVEGGGGVGGGGGEREVAECDEAHQRQRDKETKRDSQAHIYTHT
jgi:hypothetical protein